MCKGLGLDLCGISRMEALLRDERFLNRYFTPAETAYVHAKGAGAAQQLAGMGGGSFLLTITHEGDTAAAAALWQA